MPKQAITPSTVATDNIQTKPDVVIGQATSLKQSFDQYGIDSNDYINNTLIPELNGDDGSKRIGHNSPNIGSDNVADALEELQSNIVSVVAGSNPDNSITDIKLSNTAGQVKPRLATLEGTVSTLSTNVSTVTTNLSNFEDDFEYPLATIVSRQIRIAKLGTNKVSRFKLDTAIPNGASITISLDGGATSLPLKDINSNSILELEKGFYEVIADATFFTLRPSGGKKLTGDNVAIASSVSGTTLKLTPPKGCFDGVVGNDVTITDADYLESNIKKNINLFGKIGSLLSFLLSGAGTYIAAVATTTRVIAPTSTYTKVKEIRANVAGTYRVKFNLYHSSSSYEAYGRIYKNGVAFGIERTTTSTTPVEFTQDLAFAENDLIQLYIKGTPGNPGSNLLDVGVTLTTTPAIATVLTS